MAVRESPAVTTLDNALAIGLTGTPIIRVLSATAALDFASTLTLADSTDLTVAVVGAAVGDSVFIGLPAAPTAGFTFMGFVSAADVVTVRAHNCTAGTVDPASATYRVVVVKF